MENEWEKSILAELIDVKHGYAFKSVNFSDEETKNILLTPGNFKIGGGFSENKFKYYKEGAEIPDEFILNTGDLIVTMTDLSKNGDTLGYPAIVPSIKNKILLHNQRLGKIIVKNTKLIDTNFLYYLFCTEQYRQEVLATSTGTTVKHTAPKRILGFEFLLPSFKEQESIANILSSLDSKILLNNQMSKTLEQIAQTLFKRWFIDFEFPDENGNPYKSSGGRMIDSKLGEIPEGWGVKKLGDIAAINENSIKKDYLYNEISYIDISSVDKGKLIETTKYETNKAPSRAKRIVKNEDIIWSTVRPNRKSYLLILNPPENLIVSTGFAVISPKVVPYSYLYFWVTTDSFVDYLSVSADGSAYPAVTADRFKEAKVLLPERNLLKEFDRLTSSLLLKMNFNSAESLKLTKIRDFLLPKLMSGKIRVQIDNNKSDQNIIKC